MQFVQQGEDTLIAGANGRTIAHIKCYIFQLIGHYLDQCPTNPIPRMDGVNLMQVCIRFVATKTAKVDISRIGYYCIQLHL